MNFNFGLDFDRNRNRFLRKTLIHRNLRNHYPRMLRFGPWMLLLNHNNRCTDFFRLIGH